MVGRVVYRFVILDNAMDRMVPVCWLDKLRPGGFYGRREAGHGRPHILGRLVGGRQHRHQLRQCFLGHLVDCRKLARCLRGAIALIPSLQTLVPRPGQIHERLARRRADASPYSV
jgi:hypothetical protein